MKVLNASVIGAALLLGMTSTARAETVQAAVKLVSPLAATITDINFGQIVPGTGGSVTLSTSGGRTTTGGVVLGNPTGVSEGVLALTGANNGSFSVEFGNTTVTLAKSDNSSKTLTLDTLKYKVNSGSETAYAAQFTGSLTSNGLATVRIGGKLTIPSDAVEGDYSTSHSGGTPLTVTLAYN